MGSSLKYSETDSSLLSTSILSKLPGYVGVLLLKAENYLHLFIQITKTIYPTDN